MPVSSRLLWLFLGYCLLGCRGDSSVSSQAGSITYSELPDGSIVFTTDRGELCKFEISGRTVLLRKSANGSYTDVEASHDGKSIAVVQTQNGSGSIPEIILMHLRENGELMERVRLNGAVPRFSVDGQKLYFAKPTRFVKKVGLGGNFWVDYRLYSFDVTTNLETLLVNDVFQWLDDLAVDSTGAKLFVSVSSADFPVTEIVAYDMATKKFEKTLSCEKAHICSGDPGISNDSRQLVFISDRDQEFHYRIFLQDLVTKKVVLLAPSKEYRFARRPSFSRAKPGSVLALSTSSFTFDGSPKLALVRFSGDQASLVIPNEILTKRILAQEKN